MKFCNLLALAFLGATLVFGQQSQKPQVLFSGPPPASAPPPSHPGTSTPQATDAERRAITITAWDLDVHLTPRDQSMETHARVTLRNDGTDPLQQIPLQLSSTLHFESIGLGGRRVPFTQTTIHSDADHTGQLCEAVIALSAPLAPHAELSFDVNYGGTIPLTAQRLMAIGAPAATAEASDWDRISDDFVGLRGFGDVVWYPVSSVPVALGSGDALFTEIGRQKLLDQDATIALRITDEFFNEPPTAALLDGHFVPLDKPAAMPTAAFPGVITCSIPATRLGFETPSLFLAQRTEVDGNGLRVLTTASGSANAQGYITAAGNAQELIHTWLGSREHPPFTILELPEPDDAPAEAGDLLATPLSADSPAQLAPVVVHGLAHAAFSSPRAWLNEGVASFLGSLWIDSTQGHTAAMENLNADRPALALAEPATPGASRGQDLLHAVSAIYYRTKASYVLWMLRDMLGDPALKSVLQAYNPAHDTHPDYFEHLIDQLSGKDVGWFFDDWIYHDRGLPDLSIGGVYPSPEAHQQVLVAVDIANAGYADAEVPVTVKGANTTLTQQIRVPAHGHITHRFLFQENPVEVDVNDGSVPEVQDSIHSKLIRETQATAP